MSTSEHILETTRPVTALWVVVLVAPQAARKKALEKKQKEAEKAKKKAEKESEPKRAGWPDGNKNLPGAWKGLWKDGIGISW